MVGRRVVRKEKRVSRGRGGGERWVERGEIEKEEKREEESGKEVVESGGGGG